MPTSSNSSPAAQAPSHFHYLARTISGVEPTCPRCLDLGFHFVRDFNRAASGGYEVCECQKKIARCAVDPATGIPQSPYEYYDEEQHAVRPCPTKPAMTALARLNGLEKRSGIPERYLGRFLDDIDVMGEEMQSMVFAMDAAEAFIAGKSSRGLYIWGGTGSGKTLLACSILNEVLRFYRMPVRFAKINRDILGRLRQTFQPNSETYGDAGKIERELASVHALVIDDFGVQRETDWANQVLYDLIDARYEKNLPTILTSNEPLETWKDVFNGRVFSRLKEMCHDVQINVPDYRLRPGL